MEQRELLSFGPAGGNSLTRDSLARALAVGRSSADRKAPAADPLMPAAVLVPLVGHADGLTVLLTQRTAHLYHHGGQISFPGGRIESADRSPEAAALRETEEEIGLAPDRVDLLGRLDEHVTGTGFHIVPIVGLIDPPLHLTLDPFEVAEAFEVPLAFIMSRANHQRRAVVTAAGEERWSTVINHRDRQIWGATAPMLVNLSNVLAPLWTS